MFAETAPTVPAAIAGNNKDPAHPNWHFGAADGDARHTIEHFIAAGFLKAYGARLSEFMPELMGLYHDNALVAACGLRPAANEKLFLEQYLDDPVEHMLDRVTGASTSRKKIIEVGNLSVSRAGYARHLVAWLTQHLHDTGMQWALFSAVPALRNNFLRLGIPMITLAPADPARLPDNARANWGSYYEQQPQVTAVHVATAFATLDGNRCNR
jgi:hypothetical protein